MKGVQGKEIIMDVGWRCVCVGGGGGGVGGGGRGSRKIRPSRSQSGRVMPDSDPQDDFFFQKDI